MHGTLVATTARRPRDMPAHGCHGGSPARSRGPGPTASIGVAPEAQLLSVSAWLGSANPAGKSDQEQIPDAVRWAVDNGARVINMSLGSTSTGVAAELGRRLPVRRAEGRRHRRGRRQPGLGGNARWVRPATIPGVLTVGGLDREGTASQRFLLAGHQHRRRGAGRKPGRRPARRRLRGLGGTSGATPIVSGVAALIRSKWPGDVGRQVINRIMSAPPRTAGAPGQDPIYGFGVLDAEAALKADVPAVTVNPLGYISDWIRVHRRGTLPSTPAQSPAATPPSAAPTLARSHRPGGPGALGSWTVRCRWRWCWASPDFSWPS